jgi:hypothetical protein
MSQANAFEQYFLELINAERAKTGAQPLAFNDTLNGAAELHSQWMIATDTFSHPGAGGSNPTARMSSAGFTFAGSWASGENIAWASLRGAPGYDDEVTLLHSNLMNSPDHKANILNPTYQEIGLGFEVGQFGKYQGAFITEDFAKSGTAPFLTGVAFRDLDADHAYDPGEGIAGLSVTVVGAGGATYSATTGAAGGYSLRLPASNYTVTFSGATIASDTHQVTVGAQNVKLDLVNPLAPATITSPPASPAADPPAAPASETPAAPAADPPPPIVASKALTGTSHADVLQGAAGNDTIQGAAGADKLLGNAGADAIDGGAGNDQIYGGAGADVLTGGKDQDYFVFDSPFDGNADTITDFSHRDDTFWLDNDVFTAFKGTGGLASSAFYAGAAAHDASDRIMYDPAHGAVIYDPDGTGALAGIQFAQVGTNLGLTAADFTIIG